MLSWVKVEGIKTVVVMDKQGGNQAFCCRGYKGR